MQNNLYSQDLETNILGSMMNEEECYNLAIEKHVTSEMFYYDNHKEIFKAMKRLAKDNIKIDLVTLVESNKKDIEKLGGITYLAQLNDSVASTVSFTEWLEILKDYYKKRKLKEIAKNIITDVENNNTLDVISAAQKEIENLYVDKSDISFEERVEQILEEQENKQRGLVTGLETGIKWLDKNLGGLHKTELITIFARSGVGKTTLAVQIAANMQKMGKKILYVSNEMSDKEIFDKMIATRENIEFKKILNGLLDEQEYNRYATFYLRLAQEKNIEVIQESNINAVISKIKRQKSKNGLDIVFIDYINLTLDGTDGDNMTLKIGDAMQKLKKLAMNENICVVIPAQAKQTVDKNNSNLASYEKVSNSDIQDSARIEQFSNVVISLYRNLLLDNDLAIQDKMRKGEIDYFAPNPDINPNCCSITINKSRYGGKTTFCCNYEGQYSRISDYISNN